MKNDRAADSIGKLLGRNVSESRRTKGIQLSSPLVKLIDHAVLHPSQTDDDVRAACRMCAELVTASVCVKPSHVPLAVKLLEDSLVRVGTVIGFPHGGTTTEAKVAETEAAIRHGVHEVDMVVNVGKVLSEDWQYVHDDVQAVVETAGEDDVLTKVIFETGLLPDDQLKIRLCEISEACQAAFVKTSTGFGFVKNEHGQMVATGATEHDVKLMRSHCGPQVDIKASGGIRSFAVAQKFVALGAMRIGTSSTTDIAADEIGKHDLDR